MGDVPKVVVTHVQTDKNGRIIALRLSNGDVFTIIAQEGKE